MGSISRLRTAADFNRVAGSGRRTRRDGLVVFAAPAPVTRVGFAIPRSTGSAVERNRTRRRLRAIASQHLGSGYEVAVRAETAAVGASYQELEVNLTTALRELGAGAPS